MGGAEDDGLHHHRDGHAEAPLVEAAPDERGDGQGHGPEAALLPRTRLFANDTTRDTRHAEHDTTRHETRVSNADSDDRPRRGRGHTHT